MKSVRHLFFRRHGNLDDQKSLSLFPTRRRSTWLLLGVPGRRMFIHRSFQSSTAICGNQKESCIYHRYRNPTAESSRKLLEEIERENRSTLSSIHKSDLYATIYAEVQQAVRRAASSANSASAAEVGPTGKYRYFWKIDEKETHPVYYRFLVSATEDSSKGTLPSRELQVVLPNFITTDPLHNNNHITGVSLSMDETLVAFSLNHSTIHIRHIESDRIVQVPTPTDCSDIAVVEFGGGVGDDKRALFWVGSQNGRPCTVYRITVDPQSLAAANTEAVFHSTDPTVHVHVRRCKGGEFVSIEAQSQSSNEIWLAGSLKGSDDDLKTVQPREEGIQYHVDVGSDQKVFLLTQSKDQSAGHLLFEIPISDLPFSFKSSTLKRAHIRRSPQYVLEDMDIFQGFVVLYERSVVDGRQQIRVKNRKVSGDECIIPNNATGVSMVSPGGNMNYNSTQLRFHASNPCQPQSIYEYDMVNRTLQEVIPQGCKRIVENTFHRCVSVESRDGTRVPLSLVGRMDLVERDTPLQTILMGYGAYGESVNTSFDPALKPLLDRGYVLAYAHCRGGGDLGRQWHERGRRLEKLRGVEDYLACAQALHEDILEAHRPVQITARAFSAGGVIVGAALNQRPDLFRCAVLANAFLDVKATLENPRLHLTQHDWDEYGNPSADTQAARAISSYCPVTNVNPSTGIPRFLLIAQLDDKQVPFWNSLIYAKKVRDKSPDSSVLLHFATDGGHAWERDRVSMAALQATFVLQAETENAKSSKLLRKVLEKSERSCAK